MFSPAGMQKNTKQMFLYFSCFAHLKRENTYEIAIFRILISNGLSFSPSGMGKTLLHGFGAIWGCSNKHHGHSPISPLGMGKKECVLGLGFAILGPPGPDSALMGPPGLAIFPIRNGEKC